MTANIQKRLKLLEDAYGVPDDVADEQAAAVEHDAWNGNNSGSSRIRGGTAFRVRELPIQLPPFLVPVIRKING